MLENVIDIAITNTNTSANIILSACIIVGVTVSASNSANDNPNAGVDAGVNVSASARRIVRSISILFHIKKIFYNIVCYDSMIEIFIALCVHNAIKIFD